MNALQLTIGRILLAASHCGQQTFDFIEEDQSSANVAGVGWHSFSVFPIPTSSETRSSSRQFPGVSRAAEHGHVHGQQSATFSSPDHPTQEIGRKPCGETALAECWSPATYRLPRQD